MTKIAIAGSPKSGKTTMTEEMSNVYHTDDLIPLGWNEASEAASNWFDDNAIKVVEGVTVPHALRMWLLRNFTNQNKPVDKVIYLSQPFAKLSTGQAGMATGAWKVYSEIKPELIKRGVLLDER